MSHNVLNVKKMACSLRQYVVVKNAFGARKLFALDPIVRELCVPAVIAERVVLLQRLDYNSDLASTSYFFQLGPRC